MASKLSTLPVKVLLKFLCRKWARRHHLLTESGTLYGIAQDNPETTSPEQFRYDACIVLPAHFRIDNHVQEGILLGRLYAVFSVQHTAEAIQHAWQRIFGAIQLSEYQMDNRPILEKYSGDMTMQENCEICDPIKQA
ncbi:GyrI-like domain-containing protein [Paenibacillus sp. MY03]|uniref:AraC family transcriptional regulator n=1 Tax=Paenibacillus sp. MY03 TaxID=302980 RepID=UPI0015C65589|nr:GyrI-like domain-containing protein [Paenibacillus sp. MY03]